MSDRAEIGQHLPGDRPRLGRLTKGRVFVLVIGAVVVMILLVAWGVEVSLTQPVTLVRHGALTVGAYGYRNYSVQFYLDRPGHLSGSWDSPPYQPVPRFTTYLYPASSCHTPTSYYAPYVSYVTSCTGAPLWTGKFGVIADTMNTSVGSGSYELLWVAPNATLGPYILIATPLTLTPSPWWWV